MDTLKLTGTYNLKCFKSDGTLKWEDTVYNTVVTAGKAELVNLAGNVSSPVAFTYLAVGTSSTAVASSQTALGAEIVDSGLARVAATVSRTTTTTTNDTLTLTYTWTVTGTKAIEEIGVFNDATAGIMLSRALTGTKNLLSGETFVGTYNIELS